MLRIMTESLNVNEKKVKFREVLRRHGRGYQSPSASIVSDLRTFTQPDLTQLEKVSGY